MADLNKQNLSKEQILQQLWAIMSPHVFQKTLNAVQVEEIRSSIENYVNDNNYVSILNSVEEDCDHTFTEKEIQNIYELLQNLVVQEQEKKELEEWYNQMVQKYAPSHENTVNTNQENTAKHLADQDVTSTVKIKEQPLETTLESQNPDKNTTNPEQVSLQNDAQEQETLQTTVEQENTATKLEDVNQENVQQSANNSKEVGKEETTANTVQTNEPTQDIVSNPTPEATAEQKAEIIDENVATTTTAKEENNFEKMADREIGEYAKQRLNTLQKGATKYTANKTYDAKINNMKDVFLEAKTMELAMQVGDAGYAVFKKQQTANRTKNLDILLNYFSPEEFEQQKATWQKQIEEDNEPEFLNSVTQSLKAKGFSSKEVEHALYYQDHAINQIFHDNSALTYWREVLSCKLDVNAKIQAMQHNKGVQWRIDEYKQLLSFADGVDQYLGHIMRVQTEIANVIAQEKLNQQDQKDTLLDTYQQVLNSYQVLKDGTQNIPKMIFSVLGLHNSNVDEWLKTFNFDAEYYHKIKKENIDYSTVANKQTLFANLCEEIIFRQSEHEYESFMMIIKNKIGREYTRSGVQKNIADAITSLLDSELRSVRMIKQNTQMELSSCGTLPENQRKNIIDGDLIAGDITTNQEQEQILDPQEKIQESAEQEAEPEQEKTTEQEEKEEEQEKVITKPAISLDKFTIGPEEVKEIIKNRYKNKKTPMNFFASLMEKTFIALGLATSSKATDATPYLKRYVKKVKAQQEREQDNQQKQGIAQVNALAVQLVPNEEMKDLFLQNDGETYTYQDIYNRIQYQLETQKDPELMVYYLCCIDYIMSLKQQDNGQDAEMEEKKRIFFDNLKENMQKTEKDVVNWNVINLGRRKEYYENIVSNIDAYKTDGKIDMTKIEETINEQVQVKKAEKEKKSSIIRSQIVSEQQPKDIEQTTIVEKKDVEIKPVVPQQVHLVEDAKTMQNSYLGKIGYLEYNYQDMYTTIKNLIDHEQDPDKITYLLCALDTLMVIKHNDTPQNQDAQIKKQEFLNLVGQNIINPAGYDATWNMRLLGRRKEYYRDIANNINQYKGKMGNVEIDKVQETINEKLKERQQEQLQQQKAQLTQQQTVDAEKESKEAEEQKETISTVQ